MEAWKCYLMKSSPRYEEWRVILGSEEAPIINPTPIKALLGEEEAEVYKLDIAKLTLVQKSLLVDFCLRRLGANITGDQRAEIEREINEVGFPIRAEDVTVAFDHRFFT